MTQSLHFLTASKPDIQPVRLLVSARAYQAANSVFLSQRASTSRAYQPRNQPANRPMVSIWATEKVNDFRPVRLCLFG